MQLRYQSIGFVNKIIIGNTDRTFCLMELCVLYGITWITVESVRTAKMWSTKKYCAYRKECRLEWLQSNSGRSGDDFRNSTKDWGKQAVQLSPISYLMTSPRSLIKTVIECRWSFGPVVKTSTGSQITLRPSEIIENRMGNSVSYQSNMRNIGSLRPTVILKCTSDTVQWTKHLPIQTISFHQWISVSMYLLSQVDTVPVYSQPLIPTVARYPYKDQ